MRITEWAERSHRITPERFSSAEQLIEAQVDERANMISPAPGSTLGRNQRSTWSRGTNVAEYYLWIGSRQDCTDILEESQELNTSRTVTLLEDGRTIYLTLFSHIHEHWEWMDYQFRTSSGSAEGGFHHDREPAGVGSQYQSERLGRR